MGLQHETINPYKEGDKTPQVEEMFDNIAPTYDFLNHCLSLGIDKGWRRKSVDALKPFAPQKILDVACGTGDFSILLAERLAAKEVIGCDISEGMMAVARRKAPQLTFVREDCTNLSFPSLCFDAVTAAYGVRNFADLEAGFREMYRVLKPGGHLLIVELAQPPHFPMKQLFWLYSHVVMPTLGRLISHDKSAYTYLPRSMEAFPQAEEVSDILMRVGFADVSFHRYIFGLCTMFLAEK